MRYCEYALIPSLFGIATDASLHCEEVATYQCLFFPVALFEDPTKLRILLYCSDHRSTLITLPNNLIEEL